MVVPGALNQHFEGVLDKLRYCSECAFSRKPAAFRTP
jgi:hypothetical protein